MKRFIQKTLARLGLQLYKSNHPCLRYMSLPPDSGLSYALHQSFQNLRELQFIQVGANDGKRCDPLFPFIRDYGWKGTLIEPRKVFFQALQKLHGNNPAIRLVQAAITEDLSDRHLYFINPNLKGLPDWTLGLATLDKQRLEKACSELGLSNESICEEMIQCLPWEGLQPGTNLSLTDVLVVDAEGYDLTLLNLWNWTQRRPKIIHFEHACSPLQDYFDFLKKASCLGYAMVTHGVDTTLFLPLSDATIPSPRTS
jgi:hypothetical protein